MATTIQDFFSKAATKQFSRDFLFRVKDIIIEGVSFSGNDDLIYARSAQLPGRNIENKQINYYGQTFNVPGKSSYPGSEAYSIEFFHDEQINLRKKFEEASRAVFDNETSTGQYGLPGEGNYITLEVIDKDLNLVETIQLVGASIREINAIDYTIADGTGEILNTTVTFSYHYYNNFS
jgi:hypothetical protein|tara:strand:- start:728 stop:1261 length:534 start_codon:yes stop_codon:yes gene_type:complete